jgi:hypothetical protein
MGVCRDRELLHSNIDDRWWVPFAFRLVHGFGFAGALREIGLPTNAVATTLAVFNIGVEIGQVAIVSIVAPSLNVLDRLMAVDKTKQARAATLVHALSALTCRGILVRRRNDGWVIEQVTNFAKFRSKEAKVAVAPGSAFGSFPLAHWPRTIMPSPLALSAIRRRFLSESS